MPSRKSKLKGNTRRKASISLKRTLKKTEYTDTYYIDACYNVDDVYDLTTLISNLKKLGLTEDSATKIIEDSNEDFLKVNKIALKKEECYQDYKNLPNLSIISQMRPKFIFNHIHSMDKRFYKTKCLLSNILNYEKFTTLKKHEVYFYMRDYYPEIMKKHMKPTFYISDYSYNFPKVYILRPFLGSSGSEILYISSEAELIKAIKFYNSHNNFFKRDKWYHNYRVIATEYIMNPLLYKTKKFHLRMYYIISVINGVLSSFFFDIGKMLTAAKPFNTRKPFSKDVHDTHLKSTNSDLIFPVDFKCSDLNVKSVTSSDILAQMRLILSAVTTITIKETSNINKLLYDNQENGYNLFGVDFMIDDTGTVFLIEINITPGMEFISNSEASIFSKKIFNWISECVLEPCFKGTDASKHPTYLQPI